MIFADLLPKRYGTGIDGGYNRQSPNVLFLSLGCPDVAGRKSVKSPERLVKRICI